MRKISSITIGTAHISSDLFKDFNRGKLTKTGTMALAEIKAVFVQRFGLPISITWSSGGGFVFKLVLFLKVPIYHNGFNDSQRFTALVKSDGSVFVIDPKQPYSFTQLLNEYLKS